MNKNFKYMVLGAFLSFAITNGQDRKSKKAEANFNSYAYADAIESYESLVEKGYTSEDIYKNLGNAQYQNANYRAASDWYRRLFELGDAEIEADYLYKYAQALKSTGKYEESDQWMQKFESAKSNDRRAIKFADNPDYLNDIEANSGRYDIENLAINSSDSDFAPSLKEKDLVFSSARNTSRISKIIHEWNNKPFLNLYRSTPSENGDFISAEVLSKSLNKKTHESSTAFTKDGLTVYFTRNNSENGKFNRDESGLSRLKIYRATLRENEWTDIIELPFNSDDYSTAHPTLSADEKKLYFASDMPGTYGQSDIFVVDITSDGSFGTPENLGNSINTEGRETFPFVTDSGILYFASDGHPGLGGLDIFATKIADLGYGRVMNVGAPVNGEQDDFSFIINESNKKGYFASNRDGGKGSDDIYGFKETKSLNLDCTTSLKGIVLDKESASPLGNAKVRLLGADRVLIAETMSTSDGSFQMEGSCKKGSYEIVAEKKDFDPSSTQFMITDSGNVSTLRLTLDRSIKEAEAGMELLQFLRLDPVYFDLDESAIRPDALASLDKLVNYLKQFPNIKVEIQSHTDAKARKSYNQQLSERRAKATMEYLEVNGIDKNRLTANGFGESKLSNDCKDWQKCSEQQNEWNRRSEFIVIK